MSSGVKVFLAGLGLLAAGIMALIRIGTFQWKKQSLYLARELKDSFEVGKTQTVSFNELHRLPAPVARYFKLVLKDGQAFIRSAQITHRGEFHVDNRWCPFESEQIFSTYPPGFVWDARILVILVCRCECVIPALTGRGRCR